MMTTDEDDYKTLADLVAYSKKYQSTDDYIKGYVWGPRKALTMLLTRLEYLEARIKYINDDDARRNI